jgi:hypothetical protein
MSATPKLNGYGDVRWTSHFYNGFNGPRNAKGNLYLMTYEIVGAQDSKHYRDVVDGIQVTNGTCNGKGWDVLVYGEVVDHHALKSDAQHAALSLV